MTFYEWHRRPFWVPGTEFAEDYDNLIFGFNGFTSGDELVRTIMSLSIVDSTQYETLTQYNIEADLCVGLYLHTDNTDTEFQHPRLSSGPAFATTKTLYAAMAVPWRYYNFDSPTDVNDHLRYRSYGQTDIECRTQHELVTNGTAYLQVAIENVNSAQSGHAPIFFGWNGYISTLWRKH